MRIRRERFFGAPGRAWWGMLLLAAALLLTTGCANGGRKPAAQAAPAAEESEGARVSAWLPYWDAADAMEEALLCDGAIDELVAFAAFFDASGSLTVPEKVTEIIRTLRESPGEQRQIFLSVTNDVVQGDGAVLLKSAELLRNAFASEESMDSLVRQLIWLCRRENVTALEIDFENMKKDIELWNGFAVFLERLGASAFQKGIALRVVLTPDVPETVRFPEGPTYAVMAYNLYGTHSGPGPKADQAFLRRVCQSARALPGGAQIALATGGFDWGSDGSCQSLTQMEAEALREAYQAETARDVQSGCRFFSYDADGVTHEVWYADGETLKTWLAVMNEEGTPRLSLWRLGGNRNADLKELLQ